jgi:hypothetical protein
MATTRQEFGFTTQCATCWPNFRSRGSLAPNKQLQRTG